MNFKILIIFFTINLVKLTSFAQDADAVLSKFFAVQVDETVFMRWTMSAGNTCEDTYIERSADGISYERIGLIGGICGSPDQSITFEFTDSIPLVNQTSYYRLLLGYFGYTSPQVLEFVRYNDKGFVLAPNPFNDFARLMFENKDGEEFRLVITDIQGNVVEESTTNSNEFIIRRLNKSSGVYFFQAISGGQVLYSGKLVVQ